MSESMKLRSRFYALIHRLEVEPDEYLQSLGYGESYYSVPHDDRQKLVDDIQGIVNKQANKIKHLRIEIGKHNTKYDVLKPDLKPDWDKINTSIAAMDCNPRHVKPDELTMSEMQTVINNLTAWKRREINAAHDAAMQ
jgi:hypothetical protein